MKKLILPLFLLTAIFNLQPEHYRTEASITPQQSSVGEENRSFSN